MVRSEARTEPRKRPKQARSREMVETILEATARVLVHEGYDGTTTNRVAEVAGVSVGSLYQYFPNKDSLVAELMRRHVEQMEGVFGERLEELKDAPLDVAVRALVEVAIRVHAVDPELHRVFLERVPRMAGLDTVRAAESRIEEGLRAFLERRRVEVAPVDPGLAAFVVFRAVESATHAAVLDRPRHLEGGRLVNELTALVLGYLAPKSRT